jgi:phenylpyruvate tautomerase PptA (4-oxalocrotonate tautomerase family)
MPIVTVTTSGKKPKAFKDSVFDAIQDALSEAGVPRTNKFHRFLELSPEDFRFDPAFPDARRARTGDFLLIEIVWSTGRTVLVKKQVLQKLAASLEASGFDAENVMVHFQETPWENWACAGGRLTHA